MKYGDMMYRKKLFKCFMVIIGLFVIHVMSATSNYIKNPYISNGLNHWEPFGGNSQINILKYNQPTTVKTTIPIKDTALEIKSLTNQFKIYGFKQVIYKKSEEQSNSITLGSLSAFATLCPLADVYAKIRLTIRGSGIASGDEDVYESPLTLIPGPISGDLQITELTAKLDVNKTYTGIDEATFQVIFERVPGDWDNAIVYADDIGVEKYNPYVHACGRIVRNGLNKFHLKGICFGNTYDKYEYGLNKFEGWDPDRNLLNWGHHDPSVAFKEIKNMGLNCVRFSFNANWFEDSRYNVKNWLDANVNAATAAGVYLIIDMHTPIGYDWLSGAWKSHEDISLTSDDWIWNSPDKQNRTVEIWKYIAEKYKDNKYVAGYQILTEPVVTSTENGNQWIGTSNSLAERCSKAIRDAGSSQIIMLDILSGMGFVNPTTNKLDLKYSLKPGISQYQLLSNGDRNTIFHTAFYRPFEFTHTNATWLYKGVFIDKNSYPDTTMPEYTKGDPVNESNLISASKTVTKDLTKVNEYEWVASERWISPDHFPEAKVGTVAFLTRGRMEPNQHVYYDTLEILERVIGESDYRVIRKRAISSWEKYSYTHKKIANDGWAYRPDASIHFNSDVIMVNNEPVSVDGETIDTVKKYNLLIEKVNNKRQLVIRSGEKGIGIDLAQNDNMNYFYGWDSRNNEFLLKPGNEYSVRMKILVSSEALKKKAKAELYFYNDPSNITIKRDSDAMRFYVKSFLDSAKVKDIPFSHFEFSAMGDCFGYDDLNDRPLGGVDWVSDVADALNDFGIHWAYWAYHNINMGMYLHNEWEGAFNPNPRPVGDQNKPLVDVLKTK